MSTGNKHDSGAAQGARRATEQAPESSAGGGRWSVKRKASVVLELLRGADLEATSRKHRVTIATLTQWRDRFLAGGEAGMKSREVDLDDEENRRLKSVVANLSVDNELPNAKNCKLIPAKNTDATIRLVRLRFGTRDRPSRRQRHFAHD